MPEGVSRHARAPAKTGADRRREMREDVVGGIARIGDETYPLKNWSPSGFCIGPTQLEVRPGKRLDIHFTIPLPERTLSFRCRTGIMRYDAKAEEIGGIFFNLPEDVQEVVDAHFEVAAPKGYGTALFERLRGAIGTARRREEAKPGTAGRPTAAEASAVPGRDEAPVEETRSEPDAIEAEAKTGPALEVEPADPEATVGGSVVPEAGADFEPAATGAPPAEASEEPDRMTGILERADERVRELYRRATAGNDAEAQYALGYLFETGEGVPQDLIEAVAWYLQAAEQGHAGAQNNLGLMHYAGRGVPQDHAAAVDWYRRAAEQGDSEAQFNLGLMHCYGHAVAQDYVEAHKWWSLAAAQGNESARMNLDDLAAYLSADDLAEAGRRARAWREAHGAV